MSLSLFLKVSFAVFKNKFHIFLKWDYEDVCLFRRRSELFARKHKMQNPLHSRLRIEQDDVWHRVIVSGGCRGSDDQETSGIGESNEGSGGTWGHPNGQGYWLKGSCISEWIATQLFGLSFWQGETPGNLALALPNSTTTSVNAEQCGAGCGWFWGQTSRDNNCGSSF